MSKKGGKADAAGGAPAPKAKTKVIKEALACNLPIVSVDVGDVRRQIEGVDGCVLCEDDEREIIDLLSEVLEETARTFEPYGLVGVYQWTLPGTERTYLRFCFVGDVSEPIAGRSIDPEIHATHWLTRAEIASGQLETRSPLVLRCIDDAVGTAALPLAALPRPL